MLVTMTLVLASAGTGGSFVYDDTPYLGIPDSPFVTKQGGDFYLEDFESGAMTVPGVTADSGWVLGPGHNTDSVDTDDGVLDGLGLDGHSWFIPQNPNRVTFSFEVEALGALPTAAGFVWTDGNAIGPMFFEALDAGGDSIGIFDLNLGDDVYRGQTAEDRFVGWEYEGGISAIRLWSTESAIEIDHLQFFVPSSVPAPGALSLLAAAGLVGRGRRRR